MATRLLAVSTSLTSFVRLMIYPGVVFAVSLLLLLPENLFFVHLPLHAVLETAGALIALFVTSLILIFHRDQRIAEMPLAVPLGLITMGLLDVFHAAVEPGEAFVWLHSLATFVGGLMFATVSQRFGRRPASENLVPLGVSALVVVSVTALSISREQWIPAMLVEGEFTLLASLLNLSGGLLFLFAAYHLNKLYERQGEKNHRLFALHCALFGTAGLIFELSTIWDAAWWWWHAMRLLAYSIALLIMIQRILSTLLEHEKQQRMLDGISNNTSSVMYVKDTDGRYLHVNKRYQELFGITQQEIYGKRDMDVFPQDIAKVLVDNDREVLKSGQLLQFEEQLPHEGETHTYLSLKFPLREKYHQVYAVAGISTDITHHKQAEQRLLEMAHYDELTGLPNRNYFMQHLVQQVEIARRHKQMLAVLFLDLDRFKNINDSLGHPYGDNLLKQVALRLNGLMRREDVVARLGGDEFVCLLPNLEHRDQVAQVARKIIDALSRSFNVEGYELNACCSIGISLFPDDGSDGDTLIKHADSAMYRAKDQGRNRYEYYTHELTRQVSEKFQLESELRRAIARNEFYLLWQPQFSLSSGELIGAECLIRWDNPERGLVPPTQFIPLAEESDLIVSIGDWVLCTAIAVISKWQVYVPHLKASINLSPRQLSAAGLSQRIRSLIEQYGVNPWHIQLELTESGLMQDREVNTWIRQEAAGMGLLLSIDDFGTGYSSLSRLKTLPINQLKIDRSFVTDIPADENDIAITRSIIGLAQGLELEVVAEGVETAYQEQFLREAGCDIAQGYYYSKPISADEFEARYLAKGSARKKQ
ncbi:MAG: EAL domain-containing protein [Thiohalophilus sp.]|uniref:bifunctional diguanylate cyclase/phosphodiesterase n=1 Tax=Thiohalophilus sp. TaxID=3028392 RepID=UPI00286FBD52|nr:EAL domain-containing protein [Thiohalophilus sp.]MDR9435388.1 EAL domain-containing protein [Thiohalophilus sp.]